MRVTYRQRTQIKNLAKWLIGIIVIWFLVSYNYSREKDVEQEKTQEKISKLMDEMAKKLAAGKKPEDYDYYADKENDTAKDTYLEIPDLGLGDNPGELGNAVKLPDTISDDIRMLIREGYRTHHFNQYVSDLISVRRKLPDYRTKYCWDAVYNPNLPPTTIIICFHNEAWSALLRTVHSVLDRSPENLIKEILLIDDDSDLPHLKKQLEVYMVDYPKVKIIRNEKREGLIKSRMIGVEKATANIITFLDSHCEMTPGWLEPLLDRVANNPTTVAAPVNDIINIDNLAYNYALNNFIGGFTWSLHFTWHPIPEREKVRRTDQSEPFSTPAIAGGIYTMHKHFFQALGMYDPDFDVWGAENFELSFKAWMCGGRLEICPCSHVGHIFKRRPPYSDIQAYHSFRKNSVRIAEVWMDDYKQFFYRTLGHDLGDFGDVSERKKLRQDLKCKSFDWYLKNIYPELTNPDDGIGQGWIQSYKYRDQACLDGHRIPERAVNVLPCHFKGGSQYWLYTTDGELKRDDLCMDYYSDKIILRKCYGRKKTQFWEYRQETNEIYHRETDMCLTLTESKTGLELAKCQDRLYQKWVLEIINKENVMPTFKMMTRRPTIPQGTITYLPETTKLPEETTTISPEIQNNPETSQSTEPSKIPEPIVQETTKSPEPSRAPETVESHPTNIVIPETTTAAPLTKNIPETLSSETIKTPVPIVQETTMSPEPSRPQVTVESKSSNKEIPETTATPKSIVQETTIISGEVKGTGNPVEPSDVPQNHPRNLKVPANSGALAPQESNPQ